jgi:hypothetical protein
MAVKHGVYTQEIATRIATPVVAAVGIPFVVGASPVQAALSPAAAGAPVLCYSWDEAVEKIGYSDNWGDYTLCEFMYSHFRLFGAAPVIFCNLLDPATMASPVAGSVFAVDAHKARLPLEAVDNAALVVKAEDGEGDAYVKDTDYAVFYDGEYCVVELLSGGAHYAEASLNIAYAAVSPASVAAPAVALGFESVEQCMSRVGIVPDLLCAPGFSGDAMVAAVMATKAAAINGLFSAKALIDVTAAEYADVPAAKTAGNLFDVNQVLCWPKVKLGDKTFHLSTQLAGLIASVDTGNAGVPYESPSNKALKCDGAASSTGDVFLTLAQANYLNEAGVVTALNFTGGWKLWGNYTACYPNNTDVKDYFLCISRMFDFVGKTVINTFWERVDNPMNTRLIGTMLDTCNIWLNGLAGQGYILGGRAEFLAEENPETSLMAGVIKVHIFLTPPSPAQEIDFLLEYDASYVAAAFGG